MVASIFNRTLALIKSEYKLLLCIFSQSLLSLYKRYHIYKKVVRLMQMPSQCKIIGIMIFLTLPPFSLHDIG